MGSIITRNYLTDLIKVSADQLLLLNKLDVGEGLGREFNSLVKPILTTVGYINQFDDLNICHYSKTIIKIQKRNPA